MTPTNEFLSSMRAIVDGKTTTDILVVDAEDITCLLEIIDGLVPVLDRLEEWMMKGATIKRQGAAWHLFRDDGEGIVSGDSIREMLTNLIFHEET